MLLRPILGIFLSLAIAPVHAASFTAQGAVTALTNISQISFPVIGTADFDSIGASQSVPADTYSSNGLTFLNGAFAIGSTSGSAVLPFTATGASYFPGPIGGGGTQVGNYVYHAGVAQFDPGVNVTQFGLTASKNGTQYLTAWDTVGVLIGQVTWTPSNDSSFVGIDTGGIRIGAIAYGNDDLFNGATYNVGGATIISDSWIWAGTVSSPASAPEPAPIAMALLGLVGMHFRLRRKPAACGEV